MKYVLINKNVFYGMKWQQVLRLAIRRFKLFLAVIPLMFLSVIFVFIAACDNKFLLPNFFSDTRLFIDAIMVRIVNWSGGM